MGYENGSIFNIGQEFFEKPLVSGSAITYLQLVDDQILVAASQPANLTSVRNASTGAEKRFEIDTLRCYKLKEKYLLLVNPEGCFLVSKKLYVAVQLCID